MNINILSTIMLLVSFLFSPILHAQVHEKMLANGLKVIVKQDHRAPVATAQVWYKVGSANEYGGITGVSHVLEHMMFKGTPKYPLGQFSQILAAAGARDNAFTSRDYTAYFQLLAASELETSFRLESDRMAALTLDEGEFLKEIEVVKEERRLRTDDNPNALTYEQFNATAFNSSAYHNPVIGWMNDLDNMNVADLKVWYESYYSPANATLVVVGDVQADDVFALAERYYGVIPKRNVISTKPRLEPAQKGSRRVEVKAIATLPYLMLGYKVPTLGTATDKTEAYALNILAGILDGGRSARLSKHLVREQEIAASAGAGYSLYSQHESLFMFEATPNTGSTVDQLEQALEVEIKKLQTELVSAEELARVKAQVVANEVYQLDSVQRQAYMIGSLESVGLGWQTMQTYAANVQSVTAEQVRAAAQKYLIDDTKTVALLTPVDS
ncbi:MAG: insulinase family protein [Candidatus Thioglobus sp.]|nr:MAG: insulinase family protein [Candidatus Thioglobus sp.]